MMKRIKHSSFLLVLLGLIFLANSCGTSSFTKQKFTNLQQIKTVEKESCSTENDPSQSSFVISSVEASLETNVTDNLEEETEINEVQESIADVEELTHESSETKHPNKVQVGYQFDFETLSEQEKRQGIINFNHDFNNTLIIWLAGFVGLLAGLTIMYVAIPFIIFLIVAWIKTFSDLRKIKGIQHRNYDRKFRTRYNWMRFLKIGFIILGTVFIFPGLIVLIAWLAGFI